MKVQRETGFKDRCAILYEPGTQSLLRDNPIHRICEVGLERETGFEPATLSLGM